VCSSDLRRTASFYDQEAARYDDSRWHSPVGRCIDRAQRQIVLESCDFAGRRIIELGSGTGRFTALLAACGAQVTAVDISAAMLATTAARLDGMALRDRVRLVSASAASLPFGDAEFEGGLCINVFSHLRPFAQAALEIGRVLAPRAVFLANFPNLLSPALPVAALVNLTGRAIFRDVYTHWYRWSEINRAYRAAGLKIERVIGHVYLPRRVKGRWAAAPLRGLDRVARHSWLRRFAPVVFVVTRRL
jgi:ubiquinone/menaquinone biosynthesis C-methylase UbiE